MRVLQAKAWRALAEGFSLLVSYRPQPFDGSGRRSGCETSEARNHYGRCVVAELSKYVQKNEAEKECGECEDQGVSPLGCAGRRKPVGAGALGMLHVVSLEEHEGSIAEEKNLSAFRCRAMSRAERFSRA